MKRFFTTIIGLMMFVSLFGCQSEQESVPSLLSGSYYAVGNYQKNLTPYFFVDTSDKTFRYGGGSAVSYAGYGTYTIQDGFLVATVENSNQSKTYLLEIKDSHTLELIGNDGREQYVFSQELK